MLVVYKTYNYQKMDYNFFTKFEMFFVLLKNLKLIQQNYKLLNALEISSINKIVKHKNSLLTRTLELQKSSYIQ